MTPSRYEEGFFYEIWYFVFGKNCLNVQTILKSVQNSMKNVQTPTKSAYNPPKSVQNPKKMSKTISPPFF
jgi:hypothetical protein